MTTALKSKITIGLLLFIFVLVYSPTFKTPFIMDDSHTIQSNQFVHSLEHFAMPWTTAKAYSSSPDNYGYRPLTSNFSQVAWAIGDGSVVPFQIAKKILLMIVAWFCFLMWIEWQKCMKGSDPKGIWWGAGFLAFGFFLFHPVNTQVANYIAASSTLLCGLFYSLAFYLYLRFRRLDNKVYLFLAGLAYFLAVMSKEEGITLIALLVVAELFFLRKSDFIPKRNSLISIIFLCSVALFSAYLIVSHFEPTSNIARGTVSRGNYFATQLRAYIFYLSTYFWPFQFNFDNLSFKFSQSIWNATNAVFFAINAAFASLGLFLCYKKESIGLAILGFYITILPASSVIPLAEAVNDHRHFIPFLFFSFGIILGLEKYLPKLVKNPVHEKIIVVTLLVVLASATFYRNLDFVSNKTLWTDTVLKNPNSPRAKNNLALEYMAKAEYEMASALLNNCVSEATYYYPCFINFAITSAATGDDVTSEEYFKKAVEKDNGILSSRLFYSDFLIKRGRDQEAKKYLEEANSFANGLNRPILSKLEEINLRLAGKK